MTLSFTHRQFYAKSENHSPLQMKVKVSAILRARDFVWKRVK